LVGKTSRDKVKKWGKGGGEVKKYGGGKRPEAKNNGGKNLTKITEILDNPTGSSA
jgi:hypothetical protein